jgi:hypothetical protein
MRLLIITIGNGYLSIQAAAWQALCSCLAGKQHVSRGGYRHEDHDKEKTNVAKKTGGLF